MEKNYKNFKFNDFYDKPFIDNFKALVKDENKFHNFRGSEVMECWGRI